MKIKKCQPKRNKWRMDARGKYAVSSTLPHFLYFLYLLPLLTSFTPVFSLKEVFPETFYLKLQSSPRPAALCLLSLLYFSQAFITFYYTTCFTFYIVRCLWIPEYKHHEGWDFADYCVHCLYLWYTTLDK